MNQRRFSGMNERGSFTVEAALVFPLFIVIWIPFLYLVKYVVLYENLKENVHQTAYIMSVSGYAFERAGLRDVQNASWGEKQIVDLDEATGGLSEKWLESFGENADVLAGALQYCERILDRGIGADKVLGRELWKLAVDETGVLAAGAISGALTDKQIWRTFGAEGPPRFSYSEFFYRQGDVSDWISLVAYLPIRWPDPFGFFSEQNIVVSEQTRAFVGLSSRRTEIEKEETAEEESATYYRIGGGIHYHVLSCYLIAKDTVMLTREEAMSRKYRKCDQCHSGKSEIVYVTPRGECYHRANCPCLFPDVHELSEEELASGKYTPCALCLSDGGWFS
ncbi:MAG: hypothetical protein IJM90_09020 [Firmicutes bacterium]|nr:hypothetical protein [Bacillota bacterium]